VATEIRLGQQAAHNANTDTDTDTEAETYSVAPIDVRTDGQPDGQPDADTEGGSMKIKAMAPWFGGKRTIAKHIVAELGKHRAYWEPFCGSCAVLFAKEPSAMETVNDLHGDLINLARVVQNEESALRLYAQLSRTLLHEELFRESVRRLESTPTPIDGIDPDEQRAVDYMTVSWIGRNGVSGTASCNNGFSARYTKNGGHAATRWVSAVESIPAWHHRLRHVSILNRDAFELIQKIEDSKGVVIYCDPPYVKKGAKYTHDFNPDEHERLARILRRFRKTRVVVSYYGHPTVDELYDGWSVCRIRATKALVSQGTRDNSGRADAPEILLINDVRTGQADLF